MSAAEPSAKPRKVPKPRPYQRPPETQRRSRFAQWLNCHLAARGLTQSEAAREIGVGVSAVNRWSQGGPITDESLFVLIVWAGCSSTITTDDLRGWRDEPALAPSEILRF